MLESFYPESVLRIFHETLLPFFQRRLESRRDAVSCLRSEMTGGRQFFRRAAVRVTKNPTLIEKEINRRTS